jgi:hypothetical protein
VSLVFTGLDRSLMVTKKNKTIEIEADAWQRFERAVDVVAKTPPQHRTSRAKPKPKPRKRKGAKKSA